MKITELFPVDVSILDLLSTSQIRVSHPSENNYGEGSTKASLDELGTSLEASRHQNLNQWEKALDDTLQTHKSISILYLLYFYVSNGSNIPIIHMLPFASPELFYISVEESYSMSGMESCKWSLVDDVDTTSTKRFPRNKRGLITISADASTSLNNSDMRSPETSLRSECFSYLSSLSSGLFFAFSVVKVFGNEHF